MKLHVRLSEAQLRQSLRQAGYHQETGTEINFSRRLRAGQAWPRFHLYARQLDSAGMELSLHLDQKAETRHYQATKAHNAEYDGPLVAAEIDRLNRYFQPQTYA